MNKRIKKKQVTMALNRYEKGKVTKQDKLVVRNRGREQFIDHFGLSPEMYDVDFDTIRKVVLNMADQVGDIIINMAKAFERWGKSLKSANDNVDEHFSLMNSSEAIGTDEKENVYD